MAVPQFELHEKEDILEDLQISWDGKGCKKYLEESFCTYVTTEEFCQKEVSDRINFVHAYLSLIKLIKKIDKHLT